MYLKEKDENLVQIDDFKNLLQALRYDYTMNLSDICNFLKVRRKWVNTYIKWNIPHIYLQGDLSKGNKWRVIANVFLERNDKNLLWFKKSDFFNFLTANISKFSRQTIAISPVLFIKTEIIKQLEQEYKKLARDYTEKTNFISYKKAKEFYDKVDIFQYLPEPLKPLFGKKIGVTNRSLIPHIDIEQPEEIFRRFNLCAIHDLVGYDGSDEIVRRELYREGYARIEIGIKNKSDQVSKLVYYINYNNYPFPCERFKYLDDFDTTNNVEIYIHRFFVSLLQTSATIPYGAFLEFSNEYNINDFIL